MANWSRANFFCVGVCVLCGVGGERGQIVSSPKYGQFSEIYIQRRAILKQFVILGNEKKKKNGMEKMGNVIAYKS